MPPTPLTSEGAPEGAAGTDGYRLEPAQVRFFETFGFLRLPGLFAPEIDDIVAGFEDVFAAHEAFEHTAEVHFDQPRATIGPAFIDRDPRLAALRHDPRVVGITRSLIGDRCDWFESDGNLYDCDTSWHCDTYTAPMNVFHLKLLFYLDPLDADTGALRVIPGTNHFLSEYARTLRASLEPWNRIEEVFGIRPDEVPSVTIETQPGDLLAVNFRTMHAALHTRPRRRMFSINFREPQQPA